MAIIKCPECGANVSDKAKVCPNCGNPLSAPTSTNGRASVKTGSMMGIIGSVAMILFLVLVYSGQLSSSNTNSSHSGDSFTIDFSVVPSAGTAVILLLLLGFAASCLAIIPFLLGLIRSRKMNKRTATHVSICAIILSVIALLGIGSFYGMIAICGGWLFIWQPVLELIGAIKMYHGASLYEE